MLPRFKADLVAKWFDLGGLADHIKGVWGTSGISSWRRWCCQLVVPIAWCLEVQHWDDMELIWRHVYSEMKATGETGVFPEMSHGTWWNVDLCDQMFWLAAVAAELGVTIDVRWMLKSIRFCSQRSGWPFFTCQICLIQLEQCSSHGRNQPGTAKSAKESGESGSGWNSLVGIWISGK